ncbi:MAG: glycosyltransferase family 2 protein [Myxococcales bacterium]|nr:glycosyltransferase family 2 protein [Myxococcales bacterium]
MTTPQLSACIIACNEERDLSRCLESIAFADEIVVVVDDRSTDATEKLALEAGARVELHPYEGNVEQKNVALALTTGEWVLSLDADEAVTPELAEQVRAALERGDAGAVGFELNRITWHLGRWIRHGEFYPDWQLRLFRRSAGRWEGENPHGRVEVTGPVRRLDGELEHYSYRDLADQVDRIQDFSRIQAVGYRAAGRPVRVVADLVLRPPLRFLRAYLVKQGFRDGVPGFIIAAATAFHVFLKYAKLWESERLGTTEGRASGKPGRD